MRRGATATRPTLWAPTSSGPVRSHSRNLRASQDMPRSSPGSLATHLSSLRWGRSECCRPGRLQASGARSSPRLAGPPPGTAQTWSARHLHSWLCTAKNTCMSHPGLLGFWVTPPPDSSRWSLYDCGWLARFWINPRYAQRGEVPGSLECF